MLPVLVATLLLHPVLDEATEVRLVASGAEVEWTLDGAPIGTTGDREATSLTLGPGRHTIEANGPPDVSWRILARPDGSGQGAQYVQGWTAEHTPQPAFSGPAEPSGRDLPGWPVWVLGAAGLALILVPRRNEAGK